MDQQPPNAHEASLVYKKNTTKTHAAHKTNSGGECRFSKCDRGAVAKKLCDTHYRQKLSGKPLQKIKNHGGREYQPVESRFFAKIKKTLNHPKHGECWIWIGGLQSNMKYGQFHMHGRVHQAHRAAYLHFVGPIPKNEHVHHKCGETLCVNPDHLQLSTQRENNAEMFARRALQARIAECEKTIAKLERSNKRLRRITAQQRNCDRQSKQ